jgi:hypothetical protein
MPCSSPNHLRCPARSTGEAAGFALQSTRHRFLRAYMSVMVGRIRSQLERAALQLLLSAPLVGFEEREGLRSTTDSLRVAVYAIEVSYHQHIHLCPEKA